MSEEFYRLKYLKYKTKYLELQMSGGRLPVKVLHRRHVLKAIKKVLTENLSKFEQPYKPQNFEIQPTFFGMSISSAISKPKLFIQFDTIPLKHTILSDEQMYEYKDKMTTVDEAIYMLLYMGTDFRDDTTTRKLKKFKEDVKSRQTVTKEDVSLLIA